MKNSNFLNEEALEKFLRTHPDKQKLLIKLDKTITYWRNYVQKSA